jgi:hypothetical protein
MYPCDGCSRAPVFHGVAYLPESSRDVGQSLLPQPSSLVSPLRTCVGGVLFRALPSRVADRNQRRQAIKFAGLIFPHSVLLGGAVSSLRVHPKNAEADRSQRSV